jgi:hypothetical protein
VVIEKLVIHRTLSEPHHHATFADEGPADGIVDV